VNRISIVGNSGSGKSTMARALGARLGVPVLELDSLFHQAEWTPLPTLDFQGRVREFIGTHPRFIVDGNYPAVLPDVWAAADTVIWLSPSRAENMRAIVGRTLRRAFTREVLWNGNREPLASVWRLDDPEASVIAWAWTHYASTSGATARRCTTGPTLTCASSVSTPGAPRASGSPSCDPFTLSVTPGHTMCLEFTVQMQLPAA
jgi:adenylate kinase family enzyme